jgi:2OG-Fe(II) oxygenase superfamily
VDDGRPAAGRAADQPGEPDVSPTTPRDRLGKLLAGIGAPGRFSARRSASPDDLDLEVKGVGRLRLPISRTLAAHLCRVARPARYGKGEDTLLDREVRDTWEIPKSRVRIDKRRWNRTLLPVLEALRADLGLPEGTRLRAELHSMLVYAPGQFFLPHRDSEKADEMAASLVVTLPGVFTGGALVVEHRGEKATYRGSKKNLSFVAFYADCLHEVRPVKTGHRVVLTYDLLVQGEGRGTAVTAATGPEPASVQAVAAGLREHFETPRPPSSWAARDEPPGEPPSRLVYLLDHRYTERGFGWDRLKGDDAARAAILVAAAERTGCEAVLALAEIQETWQCYEPERYGSWYGRHRTWTRDDDEEWSEDGYEPPPPDDPERYELDELVDSTITLDRWIDPSGGRAAPIVTCVEDHEVCAATPTAELEPYEAEYEGYMGNYGNTMDRWYRRAAIVVWPRERAFAVRAEAAPDWALGEIRRRLRAGDLAEARRMAASLLPFWEHAASGNEGQAFLAKALAVARDLDEPAVATRLLAPFRVEALTPARAPAWTKLLERYGEAWMRALLAAWSSPRRRWTGPGPEERMAWIASLAGLCETLVAAGAGTATSAARLLLEDAWRRLRETIVEIRGLTPPSLRAASLEALSQPILGLLGGAAAAEVDVLRDDAIAFLCAAGNEPLVPTLVGVLRAAAKATKATAPDAPALEALARHCRERLEGLLQRPARGEHDWSMAPPDGCDCELCSTLAAFLTDPEASRLEWPLAKEGRKHVHHRIDAHELPVRHQTRRSGRPYTLVLTKTEALFRREESRRRAWSKDLDWLRRGTS